MLRKRCKHRVNREETETNKNCESKNKRQTQIKCKNTLLIEFMRVLNKNLSQICYQTVTFFSFFDCYFQICVTLNSRAKQICPKWLFIINYSWIMFIIRIIIKKKAVQYEDEYYLYLLCFDCRSNWIKISDYLKSRLMFFSFFGMGTNILIAQYNIKENNQNWYFWFGTK